MGRRLPCFGRAGDFEPDDAGVVMIDLAARVVAADSSSPLTKLVWNLKQKNAGVKSSIESLREIGKPESTIKVGFVRTVKSAAEFSTKCCILTYGQYAI
jgi:hypothetical protein